MFQCSVSCVCLDENCFFSLHRKQNADQKDGQGAPIAFCLKDFTVRLLGRVKVKGRTNPFRIYHLLDGYSEDIRSLYLSTSDIFQDAVELALAGKYEPAADAFEEVLAINPMDTAAHFYLERMRRAGVVKTLD